MIKYYKDFIKAKSGAQSGSSCQTTLTNARRLPALEMVQLVQRGSVYLFFAIPVFLMKLRGRKI